MKVPQLSSEQKLVDISSAKHERKKNFLLNLLLFCIAYAPSLMHVLMLMSMLMSHASVAYLFCLLFYLVLMLMSLVKTRLKHAPMFERKITGRDCPWLTSEIRSKINQRDYLLRKAIKGQKPRKIGTTINVHVIQLHLPYERRKPTITGIFLKKL